jgi:NAD(P)-dependent dehydrogenase (short-subunit alcohol dehydrogenase family)
LIGAGSIGAASIGAASIGAASIGTQRVLVTGGGTGIGRAVAEAVLTRGGSVVVAGRRRGPLDELASLAPGRAHAIVCDTADAEERSTLLSRARALLGGLDGLVLSAGMVLHEPPGHIGEASLRTQLEVNLVAPMRLLEEAVTALDEGGAAVVVASTLAERPIATSAAYSAAKAGLLAAMRAFAISAAVRRVRFNAVSPGVVDTDMVRAPRLAPGEVLDAATTSERVAAQLEALRGLHPIGRLGQPSDVAEAVLHLLAAGWTTGTTLTVDGGILLRE